MNLLLKPFERFFDACIAYAGLTQAVEFDHYFIEDIDQLK